MRELTPTVSPPDLYISDILAERAHDLGVQEIAVNPAGVADTIRHATHGRAATNLGAIVLATPSEVALPGAANYFKVLPANSLEASRYAQPKLRMKDLQVQLQTQGTYFLTVVNHRPTPKRLVHGLYGAACRTTTLLSLVSSYNDRWFGSMMGLGFGLTNELLDVVPAVPPSLITNAIGGLTAGVTVLSPLLALTRRFYDINRMGTLPVHIKYRGN